jgi:allantoin permease
MGELLLELQQQVYPTESSSTTSLDLLPTKLENRTYHRGHFFSIWMGSVHNIPSYVTIGGFFALGLSIWQVFFTILIAAFILSIVMILNGHAGAKYGVPFAMLLKNTFGVRGAVIPGVLRGVIAAIMWFGLQTYAGSLAITLLVAEFWPGYVTIGGNWNFLGLGFPQLCSLLLFWFIHLLLIFGGMNIFGKLTRLLTPLIFLVFGGMAIWAIQLAGGIESILSYRSKGIHGNDFFIMTTCVTAILSTWVAQIVSVSDVTRFAKSNNDQMVGQFIGLTTTYLLFAFASIAIIIGSEVAFGAPIWNVLDAVERFDNKFVVSLALITICLSSLSVNMVGNIIPAGYQLTSFFPRRFGFKSGAVAATVIGILIMPWKLMENSTSIFSFLNAIGGLLSPVIGVMLVDYFLISKKSIDVKRLYQNTTRTNWQAISAVLLACVVSLSSLFIEYLEYLYRISWFTGIGLAMFFYFSLHILSKYYKKG